MFFVAVVAAAADTMRAAVITQCLGSPVNFSVIVPQRVPVPTPKANEVLIKVGGSSVNPCDWKFAEDPDGPPYANFPYIGGYDIAGTVVAVGARVSGLAVGDRTWAMALGAYAEYATSAHAARAPQNITLLEAGSLPLVGLTSLQAARKAEAPWTAANHTTVVTSGSGGTGFTAIQIAKALGTTHVVTVTSAEHIDWVKSLGADEVYDYHEGDVFSHLADNSVDFVYDNYGAKGAAAKAMRVLKPGGWLVYLDGKDGGLCHRPSCTPKAGVKQYSLHTDALDHAGLEQLTQFVDAGLLRPYVQQSFGLSEVGAAFNVSMGGQVVGKLSIDNTR